MQTLEQMRERLGAVSKQAAEIQAAADLEKRALTADEQTTMDGLLSEFDKVEIDIRTRTGLDRMAATATGSQGRQVTSDNPAAGATHDHPRITGGVTRNDDEGKWGFRNIGELAMSIRDLSRPAGLSRLDPRLEKRADPSTYGQEGSGADGGFAVAPDFRPDITSVIDSEESIFGMTLPFDSSSNSFSVPADEGPAWSTSGVQAQWEGEADNLGQSKPNLKKKTVPLHKLVTLVPVTDELLEDAPAMATYINRKAPEVIDFKVGRAIYAGTGAGQPNGLVAAGGTVSVAKEGGQAADTIQRENIDKMWSRMLASHRRGAVWLANQDIEPQLQGVEFAGTNSSTPLFIPGNSIAASPHDTLKGRPIVFSQVTETLGDKGDLMLWSPRGYLAVRKAGGIKASTSIHLWFDWDMTAFKFVLRVGGQPWLSAAVSARAGSATYSTQVTLDERA